MGLCLARVSAGQSLPLTVDTVYASRVLAGSDAVVISGEELRRSGASSLGEALLGRVPGMTWQTSSGAFGAAPAVVLRGRSTLNTGVNPLVVVDGVPVSFSLATNASAESAVASDNDADFTRVTDFPLADIARVIVIRGAGALARYGTRASAGAIVIETRRPALGFDISVSQRVGAAMIGETLETRRLTRDEAATMPAEARGVQAPSLAARAASWDSCNGFCDTEDLVFGGVRPSAQTMARISAGRGGTRGSASLVSRSTGLPVRGTSDDFRAGRLFVEHTAGDRLQMRASQLIQQTEGNHPLQDGTGPSIDFRLGTLLVPSWLNLRGVPGFFADTTVVSGNPLTLAERVPTPRSATQYVTQGGLDLHLLKGSRSQVAFHATGGLHRLTQRDGVSLSELGLQQPNVRAIDVERDFKERTSDLWLNASRQLRGGTVGLAAGHTSQRWEENGERTLYVGNPARAERTYSSKRGWSGWWASSVASAPDERALVALSARRDEPSGVGEDPDPLHAFMISGSWRVLRGGWGALHARASGASLDLQSVLGPSLIGSFVRRGFVREVRRDIEGGLVAQLAHDRVTMSVNAFQSRSDSAGPPSPSFPPSANFPIAAGRLQNRGIDAQLVVVSRRSARVPWSASFMAGRSYARFLAGNIFFPTAYSFGDQSLRRAVEAGASFTSIRDANTGEKVGDLAPDYVFSNRNRVSWRGWTLSTQIDGEHGGDMMNFMQILRDRSLQSPLPDGGLARRNGPGANYLQDGSYTVLREVVLSRNIGKAGRWIPDGTRVELAGRNLLLLSTLEGYDASARSMGSVGQRGLAQNPFPRMRSLALSLVVGM